MSKQINIKKQIDIVLWGVTGFTGQICAEYFAINYHNFPQLKLAIAGRNKQKLNNVMNNMLKINKDIKVVTIIADSDDIDSLDQMTQQAKIILTTVGPYAQYGTKLVESCINNQTHYLDLTGEGTWVKKIIEDYHEKAYQSKVKIINSCGFDSIPSDISTLYLVENLKQQGKQCTEIRGYLKDGKGGFSGGTVASIKNMFESNNYQECMNLLNDPQYLNPVDKRNNMDVRDQTTTLYDIYMNSWTSPFVLSLHNSRIVRRSNALLDYHPKFKYFETQLNSNRFGATFFVLLFKLTNNLFSYRIGRWLTNKILPSPGQGPSEKVMKEGYFKLVYLALADTKIQAICDFVGQGDPGYSQTAKMICESALCLILNEDQINQNYGVLTPASAIGLPLVKRLQDAGIQIQITNV